MEDLADIMISVIDIVDRWDDLGMALGLSVGKLNEIKADYSTAKDRMIGVLRAWLYGFALGPAPSWQSLCQALRDQLVDHPEIAEAIERNNLPEELEGKGRWLAAFGIAAWLSTVNLP